MLPDLKSLFSSRRWTRKSARSIRRRSLARRPRPLRLEEMERRLLMAIDPIVHETGLISLSVDGMGTSQAQGTVQVLKPAGATVRSAYIAAASRGLTGRQLTNSDVAIDGTPVGWSVSTPSSVNSWNHWADVTALVMAKLNAAPAGLVNFTISEVNSSGIDGEILAVIFDDPNQTVSNTVALLFGAQNIGGDTFAIGLAEPIDKTDPNLALDLSLGISFGFQSTTNSAQRSIVDVNGQRLSSFAGGQDDGLSENGALLTVGGIGDSNANPSPLQVGGPLTFRTDDELYNLLPLVNQGDASINVFTQNPSNDDNIFFAALTLKSATAVVGEGVVLSPLDAVHEVGETYSVTANVQDHSGQPVANREVTFTILAGPQAGQTATISTDSDGKATFSYSGSLAGNDEIEARFVNSDGHIVLSNRVVSRWVSTNRAPTANTGGPYEVGEGGSISLTAVGIDLDGDALTFAWDLDNDGDFETSGQSVTFSAAGFDGPGNQPIAVQVDDGHGHVVVASGSINVLNVAPTGVLTGASVTYGTALTVEFTGQFDPSLADTAAGFRYAFALDSEALDSVTYATASTSDSHSFGHLNAGAYTIYARIIDADGGYTQHELQLDVDRARLTVDVDDVSWQIGTPLPTFSGTLSGQQLGEMFTVAYSSTANATSKVGEYPITAAVAGATLANYDVIVNEGTMYVTAALVQIDIRLNRVNIDQVQTISIVISGSSTFDVTQVSLQGLTFAGVRVSSFNRKLLDIDKDGDRDLMLQLRVTPALKAALRSIYARLLVADHADDGRFSETQQSMLALDGVFGQYGQQFRGADTADLFLAGKSLRDLLASLDIDTPQKRNSVAKRK